MYFKYNDITIGNDADTKVIAGAGRAFELSTSVQWNTKTIKINFFVKKATETAYRAYIQTLENVTTGIISLGKKLQLFFDDGSTWTYDPDPATTNPTALMQTPQLDYVSGSPRNSFCSGEFTFTVTMEMPSTVNGIKIIQANCIRDRKGIANVAVTGIIPKQYVNGKNDALEAFKAYFTNNVEKAILNTFLGSSYFKLVEISFSNSKGLSAISSPGDSRWSTMYFTATYQQIAFKQDAFNTISDTLVNPVYKFRPNPIPISNQKLKSPSENSYSDAGNDANVEIEADNLINQVSVSFGTEINIYSPVFGKTKDDIKNPKTKGHFYTLSELTPIYYDYIRPYLIDQVKEAFGINAGVISDELIEIDLGGVLTGGFNVIDAQSKEQNFIQSTVISYENINSEWVKAIAGKDHEGVKTIVPKQTSARMVNSYMTSKKDIEDPRSPAEKEDWVCLSDSYVTSVQGFLYNSNDDKRISLFQPAYLHSFSYVLIYKSEDSVEQKLVTE